MPDSASGPPIEESLWLSWGRSASAVIVVLVLSALGIANIGLRSQWHEVEDGVLWGTRPEGVTALEVATGSPGAAAGIKRGDLLLAVNGFQIQTRGDVVEYLHAGHEGTTLSYS